ncbi:MAG: PIN domain-containing protein [Acidimicrobiia bacterium]|nr:PIN domain-containing protein [Acidimicrobiia bacterium]
MRLVVDTGIFSASLSRRRRAHLEPHVRRMAGHQVFLAGVTVSELRYGALVAQWGEPRRHRLEESIQATTVIPLSDALLGAIAELRYACRLAGHPLHDRTHANDLWIAASALHIGAPLLAADGVFENTPGLTLHQ